eukprot:CAMPEP_0175858462 /NCGR_PEP_ID=MMETSP0107_2-20121207/29677_1 /TAXON_ID=195067 ORGANISM="Goniomonas pacifica, Strain CCMP1869" /NCGR_SAMPLE_ID=MMETSP0107_2 /ASSEMBLY_ACC=CAM_ASM_000203 /LENGTH=40 /DNA_ID= /DNA_START= /DNA_END= /DNA_ORIENTATION=
MEWVMLSAHESSTMNALVDAAGHSDKVMSVAFSGDGKLLA